MRLLGLNLRGGTAGVKIERMGNLNEEIFNERVVRRNISIVDYCRTAGAVIAGVSAGVLGLNGLYGFGFFLLYSLLMSIMLTIKAGTSWSTFFTSRRSLWLDGIFGGLFTYVLLWTFLYGMVHVY